MSFLPTPLMRLCKTMIVIVLSLASTLWSKNPHTTVCIFPITCDTVPGDSLSEICDSLAILLSGGFASIDTFIIIPFDSIAQTTDLTKSDYENEIQRQQVYSDLATNWDAEVGIHSTIELSDDHLSISIRAVEVPSEIEIHHTSYDSALSDSIMFTLDHNIETLISEVCESVIAKKTKWGYPFATDECGIIIYDRPSVVIDSTSESKTIINDLVQILRNERNELDIDPLRFKLICDSTSEWKSDSTIIVQEIQNISHQLNSYLTFWMEQDSTNENFYMTINSHAIEEDLQVTTIPPFFPTIPVLTTINYSKCKELALQAAVELSLGAVLWQLKRIEEAEVYLTHVDSITAVGGCRTAIPSFIASQYYHSRAREEAAFGKMNEMTLASADRNYSDCLTKIPSDSGPAAAWLYFNWADVRQRQEAWDDARAGFEKAKHLFARNNISWEAALMDLRIADVYINQKEWDKILEMCETALPIFTTIGDCLAVIAALEKLGPIYELKDEPNKSLAIYSRNAKLNISLDRNYEAARIYGHMGQLLRNQGDLDQALDYLTQELEIANQLQSEPALARSHFHLGTLYHAMDSTTTAITHFEEAFNTMDMLGDTLGMARAMNNIGAVYHRNGQSQEALSSYQTALNLSTRFGDQDNQIRSNSNIADLFIAQEEWDKAYQHYDQAISLAEANGDIRRAAMITYSKGLSFVKQGRLRAGYDEVKNAIEMGGGTVHGDPIKEKAFLDRLEKLVNEIDDISK